MKIKILKSAKEDLKEGFYFYELQQEGIGPYFLESLSSDIESLKLFAGIHNIHFKKYHRLNKKYFQVSPIAYKQGQELHKIFTDIIASKNLKLSVIAL